MEIEDNMLTISLLENAIMNPYQKVIIRLRKALSGAPSLSIKKACHVDLKHVTGNIIFPTI